MTSEYREKVRAAARRSQERLDQWAAERAQSAQLSNPDGKPPIVPTAQTILGWAVWLLIAGVPVVYWLYLQASDVITTYQENRAIVGLSIWWGLSAFVSLFWAHRLEKAMEKHGSLRGTFLIGMVLYMSGTMLLFWVTGVVGR